eukprot:COSAG02_NODE_3858_length_6134_cov_6.287016_9_plen_78_part_00
MEIWGSLRAHDDHMIDHAFATADATTAVAGDLYHHPHRSVIPIADPCVCYRLETITGATLEPRPRLAEPRLTVARRC